jgi:hypothetical protein
VLYSPQPSASANRTNATVVEPFFQAILDGFLHPDAELLSFEELTPQTG